ncbi:hypothetical protein NDU88_003717 [Pleurodeles waltl]|uniref:Uncharacterized protein n=1 Tax=Pleurodeles waltl TaxID=8319 RepID=A0AAV7RG03_PLEWA|nr:hypothetical protein NDU88_003717 [Pleurodeles waltl]
MAEQKREIQSAESEGKAQKLEAQRRRGWQSKAGYTKCRIRGNSAEIEEQRRRGWQSKVGNTKWRGRIEGTDSRGTEHWVGTYQCRWTPGKRTGLRTRDQSRWRGWGEALQQGGAVGAGERALAERSGFS